MEAIYYTMSNINGDYAEMVSPAPDVHFFGVGNQLLTEIWVGDGDDGLRPLPGGQALQVDHAVLRDHIVAAGAGVGADGALGQGGDDAALDSTVLAGDGGGHTDEALAPLGEVGAHHEVQLAAGAGNVLNAGRLGVDLTEEVYVHGVVDGDEVVDLGDDLDVIGVVHRGSHHVGVAVDVVIELLGAGGKGEDLAALVQGPCAGR